jgi:hypothetical protein
MRELKQALLAEYHHFSNKSIKKLDSGDTFIIDDRKPGDLDSRGNLYGGRCAMFATVKGAEEVLVRLSDAPFGLSTEQWEKAHGIRRDGFSITPASLDRLTTLAAAMRAIVVPGVRYGTASYKFTCPRTADPPWIVCVVR